MCTYEYSLTARFMKSRNAFAKILAVRSCWAYIAVVPIEEQFPRYECRVIGTTNLATDLYKIPGGVSVFQISFYISGAYY